MVVNHIGRITGKRRQAVLEVVDHDANDGSYVVASGWGPDAAWYRNVRHTPEVTIQVGRRTIAVTVCRSQRMRERRSSRGMHPATARRRSSSFLA